MVPSAIASSRSHCGATWRRFSSWRLPRTTRPRSLFARVLQESAETSRALAVAACGLVTTGSREVRDSDVGSAKLFQTRSRIAQVLRTRPEAGQAAKFFVVAGHPLTHVQELESCIFEILLKALRDVSCVPKEACEHELKVRTATSDTLAANMKAEKELCRERGPGWLHLHASRDAHRVSTMQSRSLYHVKDLVSRLVHLSLSLRMNEHKKRFRACMRGIEVDASGRLPLVHIVVVLGQRPIRCEATVSLVGVVQLRLAKQERHRALRRSSWTLRPDRPCRWTGCDLACDEVGLLLSYLAFLVSCGVKRARPFVPASGPSAAAASPDCPAPQRQQGGCNGEDDGDGSEDEVALQGDTEAVPDSNWSSGLTETDWHTMNKQYRLGRYNFVVAAPLAELLMLRTCLEPFRHLLAAHLLLTGESWEKEQQAADTFFWERLAQNHD